MRLVLGLLLAAMMVGASAAQPATPPQSAGLQPIKLTRAVIRLHEGEVWGHWGMLFSCGLFPRELRWKAENTEFRAERLAAVLDEELAASGLKAAKTESLFEEAPSGGLQLGVVITHVDAQLCGIAEDDGTDPRFRGKMVMTAEWQVYDPMRQEVIARIPITATGEDRKLSTDGPERAFFAAFRANADQLAANEAFRAALSGSVAPQLRPTLSAITFTGGPVVKRPIATVGTSIAAIFVGDAWGTGFLIAPEGYLLTNHHVVGDATRVRIRWSDDSEAIGDVIRSDRLRDVALIKVDPRGRTALALRADPAQSGETVFAIGTPLEKGFQNTLTRGVVSATRAYEGQPYIQSDVAVDHGNSGGPLLDENGQVLGITQLGYVPDGVSHNINFFIPITDALRVLALTPTS